MHKFNEKGLGRHQKAMLTFFRKYPKWGSIDERHYLTKRVANSLIKRRLLTEKTLYNGSRMFRATLPHSDQVFDVAIDVYTNPHYHK